MDIFEKESQKIAEGVIEQLKAENTELKRMLRLAIEDMPEAGFSCEKCIHNLTGYGRCGNINCFEWEHLDEAMKLLGEENGTD